MEFSIILYIFHLLKGGLPSARMTTDKTKFFSLEVVTCNVVITLNCSALFRTYREEHQQLQRRELGTNRSNPANNWIVRSFHLLSSVFTLPPPYYRVRGQSIRAPFYPLKCGILCSVFLDEWGIINLWFFSFQEIKVFS